jgi:hypothetical protein
MLRAPPSPATFIDLRFHGSLEAVLVKTELEVGHL